MKSSDFNENKGLFTGVVNSPFKLSYIKDYNIYRIQQDAE